MSDAPILLDVSRLIWRRWTRRLPTGIDRVCLAYLEHFAPRARAVVQFRQFRRILGRDDSARLFDLLLNGSGRFRTRLLMILAGGAIRSERSAAGQIYLNVGHTGLDSPHMAPWLAEHRLRPVFLIHDLIPITHPQYCREGEAERHGQRMSHALASASGIIVNSKATEHDLERFARDRALPMPPSAVAWLGIDRLAAAETPDPQDCPYFVLVGTVEARKNHLLILSLWSDLIARLGKNAPRLVIIGQRGWEAEAAINILDDLGPLQSHVRELGRCDDATMNRLIAGARALLMPSFVEGYGLPVVEALGMGTPAIASDLEVFHEIAGDIPDYLDPADRAGWIDAITDYGADGLRRRAQLDRMAQYEAPQWSTHFARVEEFLRSI
jgi:glycosyltransferase involved in cell wall biosynthesis